MNRNAPKNTDPKNMKIVAAAARWRNLMPKVLRVGDVVRYKDGSEGRVTNVNSYSKTFQAGGETGSYFLLSSGDLSYGGSLSMTADSSVLIETNETSTREIWIFDQGIPGANRGVILDIKERVWLSPVATKPKAFGCSDSF